MQKVISGEINSNGKPLLLKDNGENLYDLIMDLANEK